MTTRDKTLATFLPAILVATGYGFLLLAPKHEALTRARRDYEQVRAKAKAVQPPDELSRLAAVAREADADGRTAEELRRKWGGTVGRGGSALCRPERIERLDQLFDRAGLRIVHSADLDPTKAPLPAGFDAVAKELGDACGQPPPRPRVLRFTGSYGEAAAALRGLTGGDFFAVPFGLTMTSGPDGSDRHEWTLHVWV